MFEELKTIEEVDKAIKEYKNYIITIKMFNQAAKSGQLLQKDREYYRRIELKTVFDGVNSHLKALNYEPISTINDLYSVLLKLQVRALTVDELVENGAENYENVLNNLRSEYDEIDRKLTNIQYYSGMDNCRKVLVSVLNRAKSIGDIKFNSHTGLVNELSQFISKMFDDLDQDTCDKAYINLEKISFDVDEYSAKDEEQVLKDFKQAIATIPDNKKQIQFGIELMALENRHRNNVNALRRVKVNQNDDIGNRSLNIKSLIDIFRDESDKEALRRFASNNGWYSRNDLTINEIIKAIQLECSGKEEFIGSILFEELQIQKEKCKEKIDILESKNINERITKLKNEQKYLYAAIEYTSFYNDLIDENYAILRDAKYEKSRLFTLLFHYSENIKESIRRQASEEVKNLENEMFDENRIKEILLSQKIEPEKIEKMSEKEKHETAIKYYLIQLNDIYLKAIRSYYTLPLKINYTLFDYDHDTYSEIGYAPQLIDDMEAFFDQMKFELSKLASKVSSSKKMTNQIVNPDKSLLLHLYYINPEFNYRRFNRKLQLHKSFITGKLFDKLTHPVVSLVPGAREDDTIKQDEQYLKESLKVGKGDAHEILGLGRLK